MLKLNEGDKVYYSPSSKGFHLASMGEPPEDKVEITETEWNDLLKQQGDRADVEIRPDASGKPRIVEREFTVVEARRRIQYMAWGYMSQAAADAGYKNLDEVLSYAEEPAVPQFQADGRAFRKWRALVKQAIEGLPDGDLTMLRKSPAELFARLPKLER